MDININYNNDTPSHYEYVTKKSKTTDVIALKAKIFAAMAELEGWCSQEKASIVTDMIVSAKPEVIVEIGVFGGKSLVPMAFALKYNKKGKIYGVDPWSTTSSADGMDGANLEWWSTIDHNNILQGLQEKIVKFKLQNYIELIRLTSEDCPEIPNVDMLHIDGNHSEKASYLDVIKWVPLVKSGGIIIFDDVNWSTTKLATEWLDNNCIKLAEYKGDNIWGVWVKP
jgi:predicted O-methyltransferase YrrM